jgi:uncharacterized protein (DUF1778 family)
MGRPRKDKSQLMNVPLRIMVTADQKRLIDQATALEGSEFAEWARAVLIDLAKRKIAKSDTAKPNQTHKER